MTSEWERLKARMVKVVECEASVLEVEHGWTRKLVSVGGWPHKYIYSYYAVLYYIMVYHHILQHMIICFPSP